MPEGRSGAKPDDFDFYVLALAWQPQWARDVCPGGSHPNALLLSKLEGVEGRYARDSLSLHGLWPEFDPAAANRTRFGWPQYCDTCSTGTSQTCNFATCQQNVTKWCSPSRVAVSTFNTSSRWQHYALSYAWGSLATHEWAKHGSCTPWYTDASNYFAAAEAALEHVASPTKKGVSMLRRALGSAVSREDLRDAFTADTGAVPALICTPECTLSEVWVGLARPEGNTPTALLGARGVDIAGHGRCSGCPRITIPAWTGCEGATNAAADESGVVPLAGLLALGAMLVATLVCLRLESWTTTQGLGRRRTRIGKGYSWRDALAGKDGAAATAHVASSGDGVAIDVPTQSSTERAPAQQIG